MVNSPSAVTSYQPGCRSKTVYSLGASFAHDECAWFVARLSDQLGVSTLQRRPANLGKHCQLLARYFSNALII